MPPCDVQTSIRIQDSLERGVSYFMAALARLKRVIDAAEAPSGDRTAAAGEARVLLYLLDEILQGTNSAERGMAVQAVARHLLDAGAIGVMTTHDLNLAGEEPCAATDGSSTSPNWWTRTGRCGSTIGCGKGWPRAATRCG